MKYRVNYEVKGNLAFLSHLEIMRLWQRAILRGGLPVAWSNGFNPRPKLSLGPARGVGIEGCSEYFDVELKTEVSSEELVKKLNDILPQGIFIIAVREIPQSGKMLEAVIDEAVYKVTFLKGLPADAEVKTAAFLETKAVPFIRKSPKGSKEVDLRAFVNGIEIKGDEIHLSLKTGPAGSIRVTELLTVFGYWDIIKDIRIQRLGLFVTVGTKRFTP
ncbi:MAG TPA: TIGR03936 family radical SAM-associated protein [Clostridiales bacterium]|nr:TIGR03936 family radical SAM-associated protein [Clostridiales bacterium]